MFVIKNKGNKKKNHKIYLFFERVFKISVLFCTDTAALSPKRWLIEI